MHQPIYQHFSCSDHRLQTLWDKALSASRNNLRFFEERKVLVEGGGYEKIWLETQPMGGEMYFPHDPEAAFNNVSLFMDCQRPDGRLPGSIALIDGKITPQFNKLQGFCFPLHAMNLYYLMGEDRAFLQRLDSCLRRFDQWLWKTRDSDGDGVLESYCVYDTGEDNALRYGDAPNYCPTDTPPEGSDVVPMASMDVTSFSYAARDTLREIALIRGDEQAAEKWRKAAADVAQVIREKLWDDARGACFDKDRHGRRIDVLCHNTLRCMYWGSIDPDMAERFVQEHLMNPDEFWTPLPLPSVAVNDPAFRNAPENNWSGQCEGLTYQRAILALERYGYHKLVPVLGRKLFNILLKGGLLFVQQFDPFTAAPSIVDPETKEPLPPDTDKEFQDSYGPTLLSALEYIAHIWGVTMVRGQIWFSLGSGMAYTYEQVWGENTYRIESDGKEASVFVNGEEKHRVKCGVRLVTDKTGRLLYQLEIE